MKSYLLDTSDPAHPAGRRTGRGPGGGTAGRSRTRAKCLGCFISLMEVLYRVWRDEGKAAGRLAYEQRLALPMEWLRETPALLMRAAEIKASHTLSLADAWIAASAMQSGAVLVHKNPEFQPLPVEREALPFKKG